MRRVVLDFIWRKKWSYALSVAMLAFWVASWHSSGRRGLEAFSFYLFLFMRVLWTNTTARLEIKMAVFALPISSKERETGLWLLGVAVPALLALVARGLAGLAGPLLFETPAVDWSWVAFSALFDFAFIGALLSPWNLSSPFVANLSSMRALKLLLHLCSISAPLAGGWAMVKYLPAGWDQTNTWTWLALVTGLGLTAVGYRLSLRLDVLGGVLKRQRGVATVTAYMAPTRKPLGHRLSSIPPMLWRQFRTAAVSAVVLLVGLGIFEAFFAGRWNMVLSLRRLVPLADLSRFPALPFLPVGLLIVAAGMTHSLQKAVRALRALPLRSWELNALLIARAAVVWFGFWLVVVLADLVLGGHAPELSGLEVFASLFGVTCLGNAAAFKWENQAGLMATGLIAGLAFGFGSFISGSRVIEGRLQLDERTLHSLAIAGIVCLIVAVWWNHRLLTRSSLIYKRTTLAPESA